MLCSYSLFLALCSLLSLNLTPLPLSLRCHKCLKSYVSPKQSCTGSWFSLQNSLTFVNHKLLIYHLHHLYLIVSWPFFWQSIHRFHSIIVFFLQLKLWMLLEWSTAYLYRLTITADIIQKCLNSIDYSSDNGMLQNTIRSFKMHTLSLKAASFIVMMSEIGS